MGNVAVTYRLMPEGVGTDLDRIRGEATRIIRRGRVQNVEERPIAFGLRALEILVIMPDEGGLVETTEEALRGLQGVQSVETVGVDLI